MKPIHPYNHPEKVNSFLSDLKTRIYKNVDIDNLINEIFDRICFIPFRGVELLKGTKIFRARISEQKDNYVKIFNNISDFSARKASAIITFGRANKPKQSVFYGSFDGQTAAREVTQWHLDDEDALIKKRMDISNHNPEKVCLSISTWELCQDMLAFECYPNDIYPNSGIDSLEEIERLKQEFEFDIEMFKISERIVIAFINEQFLKMEITSQYDYVLSTAFANLIYTIRSHPPENFMLIFKSIANDFEGYNVAIQESEFACLKFKEVNFLTCVNLKEKAEYTSKVGFYLHFIGLPSDNNKTVVWQNY